MTSIRFSVPFLNPLELDTLLIGSKIDHRDFTGKFYPCVIKNKIGKKLKIHYSGWSSKYDLWDDFADPRDLQKKWKT